MSKKRNLRVPFFFAHRDVGKGREQERKLCLQEVGNEREQGCGSVASIFLASGNVLVQRFELVSVLLAGDDKMHTIVLYCINEDICMECREE